jgi:hypothetical protein
MTRFPMHTGYLYAIPLHSSPTKSRTVLRRSRKILVSSLTMKVKLDISHVAVDEGLDYEKRLGEY